MKRSDLKVGEEYAYSKGKYARALKARVVDTEAVPRTDGYSYRKDGVRVVFPDMAAHGYMNMGITYVSESSLEKQPWRKDLYDGVTEDGMRIYRVRLQTLVSTWADHIAEEQRREQELAESLGRNESIRAARIALYQQLPDEYKQFIAMPSEVGSGPFWVMSSDKVEALVQFIVGQKESQP